MRELWERVFQEPDDDAPRRVLADALLAQGDVRGELIAIQCQLARVPEDERGPSELALAERERALLDRHGPDWIQASSPERLAAQWPLDLLPEFERGFPAHVRGRAGELAQHLPELVGRLPTLNAVTLIDDDPPRWAHDFARFVDALRSTTLERLTLPVTFRPVDAELLAGLPQLRALSFSGFVGDEGAMALSYLKGLEELTLQFDVQVRALGFTSLYALPLKSFINRGNPMGIPPSPWPELRRFTLDRVSWRGPVAEWWPKLERLELFDCKLGRRGLHALLAQGHPTVKRLGIRSEKLDADAVALLERWPSLEVLDLTACTVADSALRGSAVVSRLRCVIPRAK